MEDAWHTPGTFKVLASMIMRDWHPARAGSPALQPQHVLWPPPCSPGSCFCLTEDVGQKMENLSPRSVFPPRGPSLCCEAEITSFQIGFMESTHYKWGHEQR